MQEMVEFGLELIRLLFVQIGVDDLWDSHAENPVSEDGVGQRFNWFWFGSFSNPGWFKILAMDKKKQLVRQKVLAESKQRQILLPSKYRRLAKKLGAK